MGSLKKSLLASLAVQLALPILYFVASSLPPESGQSAVILFFPFVVGLQLGPMLLRPLVGLSSPDTLMKIAMVSALVGNFVVYAAIFHLWFTLRSRFNTSKGLPALA